MSLPIIPQYTCFAVDNWVTDWKANIRPDTRVNLIGTKNRRFTDNQLDQLSELAYYRGAKSILCFNGRELEIIAIARIKD